MRATSAGGDCNTWSGQQLASNGTFEPSRETKQWLGDYFGIVALEGAVVIAYADNSQPCDIGTGNCTRIMSARYAVP